MELRRRDLVELPAQARDHQDARRLWVAWLGLSTFAVGCIALGIFDAPRTATTALIAAGLAAYASALWLH